MFLVIMVGKKVNKYKSVIKQEKEIAKATIEKNWIIFWVWVPESYEHEMLVAGGSGQGQNLVFWGSQGHNVDSQGHNVDFFIFRAKAYTCWSARCARSGLVVSNSVFFYFWTILVVFFYQIWVFYPFLAFLSHWRLRKTNRWLRNKKKNIV